MTPSGIVESIDVWIVARVESFSHWTQRNIGLDSVWWERIFLVLQISFLVRRFPSERIGWRCFFGIIIFVCTIRVLLGRNKTILGEEVTANTSKLDHASRVLSLILCILFLWLDITTFDLWFECQTIARYFEACDDLPYGPSRFRQFIEAAFDRRVPVGAGS